MTITNKQELEIQFHKDMLNIYENARKIGYNASIFIKMVANEGGYNVAKKFINSNNVSDGFMSLYEKNRLDLTVEALVLNEKYDGLFNEDERSIARDRLQQFGYEVDYKKGTQVNEEKKENGNESIYIPALEPKSRAREYNNYNDGIRDRVIYEYLFNSRTHRWLDENIIGMDTDYSRGYQSMGILHYIGLKGKHKGLFKDMDITDAIAELNQSRVSDFTLVILSLERLHNEVHEENQNMNESNDDIDEEKEYAEGKEAYRIHRYRERDAGLVREAKKLFKQKHGKLFCEACGVNFEKVYGERGKDFIEAHHTKPVSEMEEGEKTRVEDIAMLCSNCHRMIHRKPLITVEELSYILKK
jgi:hypothetical protein